MSLDPHITPELFEQDIRELKQAVAEIPPALFAQFEQFHASLKDTCRQAGITMDENALRACIVAVGIAFSADVLRTSLMLGTAPSRFMTIALAMSVDPDPEP